MARPNILITIGPLALAGGLAWRRGFSFPELASAKADAALVRTLRSRFGEPGTA